MSLDALGFAHSCQKNNVDIGRTTAYLLVKAGHFKIIRIGNTIRIPRKPFDEWLENLES